MQDIKRVDIKRMREFGIVTGMIVAALFGLFFPWLLDTGTPLWPWVLAGVLVFWALIAPATLRPVYGGWMRVGSMIGSITTPLILGLVFFLVVFPLGLIMRLFGYDPMARELNDGATTYRVPSRKLETKSMERPF